ncbi:hypothetical protein ACOSP6_10920 [Tenacibaculum sp. MEBiC06402]|uniref:hypothetical protein n=1 Tax=unclassified Tenacibaculum TaxID=2635139 RepID=UPI003B9CDF28
MNNTPLNVTGKVFCERIGIAYNSQILQSLRDLQLISFFKVGKKYLYPFEETEKINHQLRKGEISIKVNKGYYVTLNN